MSEIADILCHRLVKYVKFFQMVPFMRAMILNGSLAAGRANEDSDIDILIVTQTNRLYTCRIFMFALAHCLGLRTGTKGPGSHAGVFCMNYFVTEDHLDLSVYQYEKTGEFSRINFMHGILIYGMHHLFEEFKAHSHKGSIVKNDQQAVTQYFPVRKHLFFDQIRKISEFILSGKLGDKFEDFIKNYQMKRRKKSVAAEKNIDFDVFSCTDKEIYFYSSENILKKKYTNLKQEKEATLELLENAEID